MAVDPDEYDHYDDLPSSSDHSENGLLNGNKKKSPTKNTRSQKKTPVTKRAKKIPKPTEPIVCPSYHFNESLTGISALHRLAIQFATNLCHH